MSENPSGIERGKIVAVYGFIGLVCIVTILDRLAPAFLPNYAPLGDTSLGLLLGAITALLIGEGVTRGLK